MLAAHFIISFILLSQVFPNYKYYVLAYSISGRESASKDVYQCKQHPTTNINLRGDLEMNVYRNNQWRLKKENYTSKTDFSKSNTNKNAERKVLFHQIPKYQNSSLTTSLSLEKKQSLFENFVTPKEEQTFPRNSYEVTTKKFKDTEPDSQLQSSTLGIDSDMTIAIDDEYVDIEAEMDGGRHPEHLNPLIYVDSYGRLHKRPKTDYLDEKNKQNEYTHLQESGYTIPTFDTGGYGRIQYGLGYGYGTLHSHKHPGGYHDHKKPSHRVRMQVYRGPTWQVGRRKYAQWGYYVVQPTDNHHQYHI